MSIPDLCGITLKLQRACDQLNFLEEEFRGFLDEGPYEPSVQFYTTQLRDGEKVLGCVTEFKIRMLVHRACDTMWGVKIGEILHNFRSALDHMVFQLYIFLHERIPPENLRLQFPIFLSASKFDSHGLKMLAGVGDKASALIKSFQPFSTGEKESSPLWHLNKLSNFDKHRTLHLAGGTVEAFDFTFPPLVNSGQVSHHVRKRGAFHHNTVIAEGSFFGAGHPFGGKDVKVNANCLFNVVFDERTPVVGEWLVVGTLTSIADRTAEVLEHIGTEIFGMRAKLPRPNDGAALNKH